MNIIYNKNLLMLHYSTLGSGSNTIILIHGFPLDGNLWENIAPSLAQDFRIVIPDLHGAGQSAAYTGELSLSIMADAILDIFSKENIEKALMVGHSMGGYTALEFLQKYPERLQGVSLVHSLASADNEEKKNTRKKSIALMKNHEKGKDEFLKTMAGNLFDEEFAKKNPEAVEMVISKGSALSTQVLVNFYTAIMNRIDKISLLEHNTSIPIQWIIGTSDKVTPYDDAIKQAHLSAINDVEILENVGHMSMIEAPEVLKEALSKFCHFCFDMPA